MHQILQKHSLSGQLRCCVPRSVYLPAPARPAFFVAVAAFLTFRWTVVHQPGVCSRNGKLGQPWRRPQRSSRVID